MAMERTALVTGASRGIGRAAAAALLADGWRVMIVARGADGLAAARADLLDAAAAPPDRLEAAPCDVADPDAVAALFDAIAARFGRLDFVFNNAGGGLSSAPIDEIAFEDWRRVMAVNLDGAFLIARGAFAQMRRQRPQGGRILNNGSISAHAPRPGSVAYTVSKHAVTGLTRALALDGRPFDIACGQIDIGNAETDLTARFADGVPQADGTVRPEPVMDVAHVADAVARIAALPLDANVLSMTLMATKMPFVGRG